MGAGQVVQAVIVPEGGNLELLREIFGEDFDKIRTDMAEVDGTSVVYTQAQKDRFANISDPWDVGDTGIKICTGVLSESAQKEMVESLPILPLEQVAGLQVNEYPVTYGEMLRDQMWRCQDIIYGAISQAGATVEQRRVIVVAAVDALKAFLETLLVATTNMTVEIPKASGRDEGQQYGFSDLSTRLIGEWKKLEKRLLGQVKPDVQNLEKQNMPDPKSASGGENMSDEKVFVTKEDMTAAISAAIEPISAKTEELVKAVGGIAEIGEAVKSIREKLAGQPKTPPVEPPAVDPNKAASVEVDLAAKVNELTEQIQALQHKGQPHVEVEDATIQTGPNGDLKPGALANALFKQRGWGE